MSAQAPPNILFIISDQHKWDVTGYAGHPHVRTPELDRLAAESVGFDQAICPSPLCVTSRAAIMTGTWPHTCRCFTGRSFPLPDVPTLGRVFRAAGYATGAIGKVHVHGETRARDLGFDDRQMRLYTYWFEDYIRAVGEDAVNTYATYRRPLARYQTSYNPTNTPIALRDEQMFDHLVVERCIGFLERHRDRPFFLWAGLDKPHPDWTAPAKFHTMYDPAQLALPPTAGETRTDMPNAWYASTRQIWAFDEPEVRHALAAYYANVSYLDAKVGELLAALDRLGLRDNTLVVYTTDHGEMLFEHGMVQKQNFFEASVRVPLLLRWPGVLPAGARRTTTANLIDLFPTYCEAAGVAAPAGLEGQSLLPAAASAAAADPARATFAEYYEWGFPERMLRTREWKYIHSVGETDQLYDLRADPHETRNLVAEPAYAPTRDALHARLMADWEVPDMRELKCGGRWNDIDEPRAQALMAEWLRTRRRIAF